MLSDIIPSYIRTGVPVAIGSFFGWLLNYNIDLPDEAELAFTTSTTGLVIAIYYAGARAAEQRWPKAGWLLGSPKQPVYDSTDTVVAPAGVESGEPVVEEDHGVRLNDNDLEAH